VSPRLRAEIIVTGSELVSGRVADVNGPFLAASLAAMGIPCDGIQVLGDNTKLLVARLKATRDRCRLVIFTGGLGPTGDDLTHQVLCDALERPLTDLGTLPEHTPARGPHGTELIKNPKGSAAGLWMDWDGHGVVALPGVPSELTAMWPETARRIAPLFAAQSAPSGQMLRTVGITERALERRILATLDARQIKNVEIGISAKPLAVDLFLSSASKTTLAQAVAATRDDLGVHIYTESDDTLAEVVGRQLAESGAVIACAESCTGGAISAALTSVAGASAYVDRGVVCYSNDAKQSLLGVPERLIASHGAVSEPVAVAMAEGLLARSRAGITLSVTGVAGPGGGSVEKPVGTVIMAVASQHGTFCRRFYHVGDRATVIRRSVTRGLDLIRRHLITGYDGLCDYYPKQGDQPGDRPQSRAKPSVSF